MIEWETEELILRSMGNGQYEDYRIVSADEAERRVLDLEAQRDALLEALLAVKRDFPDLHEWERGEDGTSMADLASAIDAAIPNVRRGVRGE